MKPAKSGKQEFLVVRLLCHSDNLGWLYIPSTVPTFDWVLLKPGKSNKKLDFDSLHVQLICTRTFHLAGRA